MTLPPCPRGHAQASSAAEGSVLCGPCLRRVEGQLRALPGLNQECLHRSSPSARRTNPTRVRVSRSHDTLDISVIDTRQRIHTTLASWAGLVAEKRGAAPPPRTVPHWARFLRRHLQWLAAQPAAPDFADEIESLVAASHQTIDPDPGAPRTLVGECVLEGCTGTVSASPLSGGTAGGRCITCSSGHSWQMHEWLGLRKLMQGQRRGAEV